MCHRVDRVRACISIHALLAESDMMTPSIVCASCVFLSTLSLRRATDMKVRVIRAGINFYPRSPCGERRWLRCWQLAAQDISIHALLAESDPRESTGIKPVFRISIHALLAESDGKLNRLAG